MQFESVDSLMKSRLVFCDRELGFRDLSRCEVNYWSMDVDSTIALNCSDTFGCCCFRYFATRTSPPPSSDHPCR
jgi:hypothetical protein